MKNALSSFVRTGISVLAATGALAVVLGSSAKAAEGVDPALKAKVPEAYRNGLIGVYDPQYPPTYYIDDSGKMVGLSIDFQRIIAAKLGIPSQEEQAKFAAIIPGILGGRYHTSFFHDTKERREKMDFIDFHRTGAVVMVAKGNPQKLDLNDLCGHKVGVASGAQQHLELMPKLQEACKSQGRPAIEMFAFSGLNEGALAVKSGRIEAWLGDAPSVAYVIKQTKGTFEKTPTAVLSGLSGFAFKKGDPMALLVRDALAAMLKDGTYQRVLDEWQMSDVGVDKPMLNGE
ncbi:ABC transporter substrate-binding protein [Enterovirga sp.]|uniref:ABC transporter substrate-binding protein n=1 Tax=Enterovirga sp. TaxID=2026350 RepID=UPI002C0B439A|nr:ABC transporter substrate-binding protein [Enterovirga sp.]HMO28910.1 ABC transporter substrate-binding protein [Enterovirga sp.]